MQQLLSVKMLDVVQLLLERNVRQENQVTDLTQTVGSLAVNCSMELMMEYGCWLCDDGLEILTSILK